MPGIFDTSTTVHDSRYDWEECPKCRYTLLPLCEYEVQAVSEFPALEADLLQVILWGWAVYVYNFLSGLIVYNGRRKKLAAQKKDVLPQYPNSLVCPQCLHVIKRR